MIELLNIDCMNFMKGCEDNAFDLAIVDPPFGIGDWTRDSYTSKGGKGPRVENTSPWAGDVNWNTEIPPQEYFDQLRRISQKQIIWGANYFNCFSGGALVWHKGEQTQTVSNAEIASLSFQNKVDFVSINWQPGFYRKQFGDQIHPCQKPVKLYDWLLTNYAKPSQKILDTHLGSGSSAIAAHYFGVDFVGCEIDKDYYDAACERFKQETAQVDMFA